MRPDPGAWRGPGAATPHLPHDGGRGAPALRDWLAAQHVTHVARESTGVDWTPIYAVLEAAFTCRLVNAAHLKRVPGRKTDVQDAAWIAELLEHGLLRGSLVPPVPLRDLRDLTRYRKVLIQERTREANRLHTGLEDAGIKLVTVATDSLGASGRARLTALVQGTTDPAALAELARGRRRAKLPVMRQALAGRFRVHHAFLASRLLAHLDYLDEAIADLSARIEGLLAPCAPAVARLVTIPGVEHRTAEVVVAEVGADVRTFRDAGRLASWAGLCPSQHESAGKARAGTPHKGNRWLRGALIEAALAASRTKGSVLGARYRRVLRHRGHHKAVVAVAHALLRSIYHLRLRSTSYQELGADYFDRRHTERVTRRAIRWLQEQGYRVHGATTA